MQKRTNETSHFYIRNKGHRIGVVAFRKKGDSVSISVSMKAPQDTWDTKLGVNMAYGKTLSRSSLEYSTVSQVQSNAIGLNNVDNLLVCKKDEITFMRLLASLGYSQPFLRHYSSVDVIVYERIFQSTLKDFFGDK